ncbi:recombinase family protein [Nitrosococcus watsonii]|uniref:recombinase family protein n=1 Tax=Nitrosococcus watsonii TaxID=473531 RepID=UPI000304BED5|nr:recombinase family protein [Nitrosococcus watsonii]
MSDAAPSLEVQESVAAIYREKASGARADRPELQRMISDLQPGELVVSERIDRISRHCPRPKPL